MHSINLQYSKIYNREEGRCGVLFRNRYKVEPIYEIKYLINCIKYIHNNLVKANMVLKCEDYKYSSYSDYMMCPLLIIVNNKVIDLEFNYEE